MNYIFIRKEKMEKINYVILVHGTWGKDEDAWYQIGNENYNFAHRIKDKLNISPEERFEIFPFEWSGENTHNARIKAAKNLANELIKLFKKEETNSFHFIAHSHGGNVVLKAIEIYTEKLSNVLSSPIKIKYKDTTRYENTLQKVRRVTKKYNIKSNLEFIKNDKELQNYISNIEKTYKFTIQKEGDTYNEDINSRNLKQIEKFAVFANFRHMIERLVTYSEFNKIRSITTMGTPFYYKKWKLSKLSKIYDKSINYLIFPFFFFIIYLIYIWFSFLTSVLGFEFVGFNIFNWGTSSWVITIFFAILFNFAAMSGASPRTKDTNIYFDISNKPEFIKLLGERKICPFTIIHAAHLDEAYLGLSSLPIAGKIINKKIHLVTQPKIWEYNYPTLAKSGISGSVYEIFRFFVALLTELIKSFINILIYPVKWLVNIVIKPFIVKNIFRNIHSLLVGLPEYEFEESIIEVRNIPKENDLSGDINNVFSIEALSVEDYIADIKINKKDLGDYSFLNKNGKELEQYLEKSMIVKEQLIDYSKLNDNDKKNILALEERGKELFGITGLRHSLYYEQSEIVEIVSQKILKIQKCFTLACIIKNHPKI